MIKIYHNPRCKKSREGLAVLENSGKEFEVVKYLEKIPSKQELQEVITCLGISPENLVRKNESIWKEKFKGRLLSDDAILEAMIAYPKLIERPIILARGKGIIGRPTEKIYSVLE